MTATEYVVEQQQELIHRLTIIKETSNKSEAGRILGMSKQSVHALIKYHADFFKGE